MLKEIITQGDNIGRCVLSQDGRIGWIETIFQYEDDPERWRVFGDEINVIETSTNFEFTPGQRRDFRIWDDGEASSAMRRDLPKEEISRLLLEALALKQKYIAEGEIDSAMFRLIYAIQAYLYDDVVSRAYTSHISYAYVDLLGSWQKENQWVKKAQEIAGKIVALRNRDKRDQARKERE